MDADLSVDPELLEQAIQGADDGIYITDTDGTIIFANGAIQSITGYTRDQLLGASTSIFKSGEMSRQYYERLWSTVLSGHVWREVITNQRANGEHYHASQTITPILNEDATVWVMIGVQRDITRQTELEQEVREMQTEVERLLSQQETLLHEVYHRVKNDLMLVHSLLDLHSSRVDSSEAREGLQEAAQRARAISQLYSLLQEQSTRHSVPAHELIQETIQGLQQTTVPAQVRIHTETAPVEVPPRLATALTIVLNELITNAVKYAFFGVNAPGISITLATPDPGALELQVTDNGVGPTAHAVPERPGGTLSAGASGMGHMIVDLLTRQFDGSFTVAPGFAESATTPGTTVTARFRL